MAQSNELPAAGPGGPSLATLPPLWVGVNILLAGWAISSPGRSPMTTTFPTVRFTLSMAP